MEHALPPGFVQLTLATGNPIAFRVAAIIAVFPAFPPEKGTFIDYGGTEHAATLVVEQYEEALVKLLDYSRGRV